MSNLSSISNMSNRYRWRYAKDVLARYCVGLGGMTVIFAIVLILFYLLYVVIPLFEPASFYGDREYDRVGDTSKTLSLSMEEQSEIALRVTADAGLFFFSTKDGKLLSKRRLDLPEQVLVSSFTHSDPVDAQMLFGLDDGNVTLIKPVYRVSYPDDVRLITPEITYPFGEKPLVIDEDGVAIIRLAFQNGEEEATIVAQTNDGRLLLTSYIKEESLFGDELIFERTQVEIVVDGIDIQTLLMDKDQQNLYVLSVSGEISRFDISDKESPGLMQHVNVLTTGTRVSDIRFLAGDISLLIAEDDGRISQWFAVRDQQGDEKLQRIRSFHSQQVEIVALVPEYNRKGFLALDKRGVLGVYHTTSERTILLEELPRANFNYLTISPRANAILMEDAMGRMRFQYIVNEHPEISWSGLWEKVWYESYTEPVYAWQSSSASNDFEPKLSLTPLVFGTLKAAFYAMLIAVPLAIMGAIYTAYFMAPRMRGLVKPSIETMEALPTVILGFLAGLWLAPLIEANLPGIFSLLIIVPLGVLLFSFVWSHFLPVIRNRIPEGWDAAILIPVVLFLGWLSIALSGSIEHLLFDNNMRAWMDTEFGVGFDQRNSLVVGIAMGFAVIPTIFTITEDAVFSVPRHLTNGSLALGATSWQTLVRVVILTASPGIFSAVMIGMGRAVGETMIVLMATGNTPVMDFSVFQGMRTLSANIAVEMPEAEVDSTHYRVLFLAALVLFGFTFVVNTLAEIVRQRLRSKYSSL
ncbi:MAG: ABC transporter permease subunit [Gammaproteobacteria bacterium]|nr:ABC transporter permease subunit [Gammaproteobacteria bacterium]